MSMSLEGSLEFEVIDALHASQPTSNTGESFENERMSVSASTIRSGNGGGLAHLEDHSLVLGEDPDDLQHLNTSERNAFLIGRRIDVQQHIAESARGEVQSPPTWERATIMNYDKSKDTHWVLADGCKVRKEYKLSEVVFRLVETEEEWVDIGEHRLDGDEFLSRQGNDGMTDSSESL